MGCGNSSVRAGAMLAMQRTHGNRAVQRMVAAYSAPTPRATAGPVQVQRTPAPAPEASLLTDPLGWLKEKYKQTKTFDDVATGNLESEYAPDKITLPKELQDGMSQAWKDSLPGGGKFREQGGLLGKDEGGQYEWHKNEQVPLDKGGNGGMFTPDFDSLGKDETLVGVQHTHPDGLSFSGSDLSALVHYPEDRLQMIQSGKQQFVSARTAEFDKRLEGLDEVGKAKLSGEMEDLWTRIYNNKKDTLPVQDRARLASMAVSQKYNILYYEGQGGELSRR